MAACKSVDRNQEEGISFKQPEYDTPKIITFRKKRRYYEYNRKGIDARLICSFAS